MEEQQNETEQQKETVEEQTPQTEEKTVGEGTVEGTETTLNIDNPQEFLEQKGFDFSKLQDEYRQNNGFTEETKTKLKEVGITDEIISNYEKGQKALVEQEINELAECVGGREKFDNILKWAGKNLSNDEIQSIEQVRDPNIVKIILKDLNKRMEEKEGKLPTYVSGNGREVTADLFESKAQMQAAILDPRYRKDEAYRRTVAKKIAASREAGKDLGC